MSIPWSLNESALPGGPCSSHAMQPGLQDKQARRGGPEACWRRCRRKAICWASDRRRTTVQHVGVSHGRVGVRVAEDFLDGADVVAIVEQMGGERMPKRVAGGWLGQAFPAGGLLHHGVLSHSRGPSYRLREHPATFAVEAA